MYSYIVKQSCTSIIGKEHVIDFKSLTKESVLFVYWHEAVGFFFLVFCCHKVDAIMTADDTPHILLK